MPYLKNTYLFVRRVVPGQKRVTAMDNKSVVNRFVTTSP